MAELSGLLHIWAGIVWPSAGCDARLSGNQTLGVSLLEIRDIWMSYSCHPITVVYITLASFGLADLWRQASLGCPGTSCVRPHWWFSESLRFISHKMSAQKGFTPLLFSVTSACCITLLFPSKRCFDPFCTHLPWLLGGCTAGTSPLFETLNALYPGHNDESWFWLPLLYVSLPLACQAARCLLISGGRWLGSNEGAGISPVGPSCRASFGVMHLQLHGFFQMEGAAEEF